VVTCTSCALQSDYGKGLTIIENVGKFPLDSMAFDTDHEIF